MQDQPRTADEPDGSPRVEDNDIPEPRLEEYRQLVQLLMENCAANDAATVARAEWIARSALEPGHLWRAMGVESRDQLREVLLESFPELVAANDKDMRWKKFLYKRICGWTGYDT
jgi:nitrogen fixation protein NifQ